MGSDIFAFGDPLGLQATVTKGTVSAVRPMDGVQVVQIDAPINPGNSGGPILNSSGVVVGISTFKAGKGFEGLGFGITAKELKSLLVSTDWDSGSR